METFTTNPITGQTFYHGTTTTKKEAKAMKNIYLTFTTEDGTIYTANDATYGYCYKQTTAGFKTRISKVALLKAYDEYKASEKGKAELEEQAKAKEEAKKPAKKASKPRKSKDIAFEGKDGVTLTKKQVDFIKDLPKAEMFDGFENGVWCDCLVDGLGWNPMAIGAMISTLREKHLITVEVEKVNGKKCKSINFTATGLEVVKQLGL